MKRGDIYLCDLGQATGHVQSGFRPVIVVQNNKGNQFSPTTIVCGITSSPKKANQPTHCFISTNGGLPKPSTVLCEQIFTINKNDLKHYLGTVSNPYTLRKLDTCIQISLGLIEESNYEQRDYNRPFRRI